MKLIFFFTPPAPGIKEFQYEALGIEFEYLMVVCIHWFIDLVRKGITLVCVVKFY
jgi:hypothetical protein